MKLAQKNTGKPEKEQQITSIIEEGSVLKDWWYKKMQNHGLLHTNSDNKKNTSIPNPKLVGVGYMNYHLRMNSFHSNILMETHLASSIFWYGNLRPSNRHSIHFSTKWFAFVEKKTVSKFRIINSTIMMS